MNFNFFVVSSDYCNYLRKYDPCVPYTMDKKSTRPFVGIVFAVNSLNYFAPLTSPKPKHLRMNDSIDFLKINNGKWGAINFNNMIPVPFSSLTVVNNKIVSTDTQSDIDYKNLLSNQLDWCNNNKQIILNKAEKLYRIVTAGNNPGLLKRCCNFLLDEEKCTEYNKLKSLSLKDEIVITGMSLKDKIEMTKRIQRRFFNPYVPSIVINSDLELSR